MLKKFFVTLLATITGVWISVGLFFLLGLVFIGAIAASQDSNTTKIERHSVLYLKLSGEITERRNINSILEGLSRQGSGQSLYEIVSSVRAAATNKDIDGIFIEADGALAGTATRLEIVQALKYFKETSEKWIVAYGDSYTQGDYFLSSVADSIIVNPMGGVDIHGLASTTYFYKGLLDKLGVKMQILKVGTYKSAVEPFMLTDISEANREQQQLFLGQIWNEVTDVIAVSRGVDQADVNNWADNLVMTADAQSYVPQRIVSSVEYRHKAISLLKQLTDTDEDDDVNFITPEQYVTSAKIPHTDKTSNNIAVLFAEGEISDSGREGIIGPKMVAQIERLIEDDKNDGLIMRVNSPGGSAFASEQIWEALQRYKATGRPFYVSMGDYAASGGYYISCGADRIYAQPVTLTGSIGIFGMIPCIEGLLQDKLSVNQAVVATNKNANFISVTQPLNEQQTAHMQQMINRGYEVFTSRCASGRDMPIDSIKAIAEGRVWDGRTAWRLGLVDRLGNLEDAIADMAQQLEFTSKYTVTTYPKQKYDFWEQLEELQDAGLIRQYILKTSTDPTAEILRTAEKVKDWSPVQARMMETVIN
ncbi:MAG: signal peptide peptidase SppA [Muribaculaceae bacterium]|nr:signal peptide peptidase SppA [Muribaculaceae bacterium]